MYRPLSDFVQFSKEYFPNIQEEISTKYFADGTELDWYGSTLIWSRNKCLVHNMALPGKIVDVTICTIEDESYVAVLYQSGLTLFDKTGHSYLIPLPFQIEKIFSLHQGLLLFRSQGSALIHEQYHDFPILFTLFHPLEEIRPVSFISQAPSSPVPKYTTIPSPTPRKIRNEASSQSLDKEINFITDPSFTPLAVSREHSYLLAKANDTISIWKFSQSKVERDLLFHSPLVQRSPSIFSPAPAHRSTAGLLSPGAAARADIKATLEGIPPDLCMELLYEFPGTVDPDSFIEITEPLYRKYILFLSENVLHFLNASNIDEREVVATIPDVSTVCKYKDLMFFVVGLDGSVVLYEESRLIAKLNFENVAFLNQLGRYFIVTFKDGTSKKIVFDIAFDDTIKEVLGVAQSVLSPDSYSKLMFSLSEAKCLDQPNNFYSKFLDELFSCGESEEKINSFFHVCHLLYEDMNLVKGSNADSLLNLLVPLGKRLGRNSTLLYYSSRLNGTEAPLMEITGSFDPDEEPDLLMWCSKCISGQAMQDIQAVFPLTKKIVPVFAALHSASSPQDIVVLSEGAKLNLSDIDRLKPAISRPLLEAFKQTAVSPPHDWPLAAYKLIRREDIARIFEYIKKPEPQPVKLYSQPDYRFIEVERLLQSHLILTVDVERPNGTDDIRYQEMNTVHFKRLLAKQWSLSVGRGLFNFATIVPMSSEKLVPKELNHRGLMTNSIELNLEDQITDELIQYPQFHNGVATGLSIATAEQSWIQDAVFDGMTTFSAGVTYAFGLNGFLKKVWRTDIYSFLTNKDIKETNAIAMLLGIGVSYRGTNDLGFAHMMALHIPELREYEQDEFSIQPIVKAAAILGLGFLCESTGQRHTTETFIGMMEQSATFETPCLAFALGAAVGLINLGMGDASSVMRENRERLSLILAGGKVADVNSDTITTFGNPNNYALSPAIIIALTLSYLQTDVACVKAALSLPGDTSYINSLLPDVVMLREMGSLLIDSDPSTASNCMVPDGLSPDILASYLTGFSLAAGIKHAGSLDQKVFMRLIEIAKCLALLTKTPFDFTECQQIRREQCLSSVLCAASLIIAGTCNVEFLRLVRFVRRRNFTTTLPLFGYGLHLSYAMAIGIANLGQGRYTLGADLKQTASMILALYPRLEKSPSDNEYVFQPLRHLVATAAVPRVLEVHDVETNEIVELSATIVLKPKLGEEPSSWLIRTPHVLPPLEQIQSVVIDDPDYYTIDIQTWPYEDNKIRPIIWVKRKVAESDCRDTDIWSLRTEFMMRDNPTFNVRNEWADEEKAKLDIEWTSIGPMVADYLRSQQAEARERMLRESDLLCKFLAFHGISPSATINDLCLQEDEAVAFLIPFLTQDEIESTFQ